MTSTSTSTPHDTFPARSASEQVAELVRGWLDLWNGDLSQAERILASDFQTHAAMTDGGDGSAIDSPQALAGWVATTRAAIPDLRFTVQVGPIASGDHLALRWRARGTYAGGIPGAAAPPGTAVDVTGTDVLRTADGRLAEYWVNSDTLLLLSQLRALG